MYRDEPLRALMEAADLIVAVGLDGIDFFKRWPSVTPVVSLAAEGAADVTYQPELVLEGDWGSLFDLLASARASGSAWSVADAAAARRGHRRGGATEAGIGA